MIAPWTMRQGYPIRIDLHDMAIPRSPHILLIRHLVKHTRPAQTQVLIPAP